VTLVSDIQSPKERTILWAIVISILFHGLFFIPGVSDLFKEMDFEIPDEVPVAPMEFTLVSPPENPTPSDNVSKYLSTVSSAASDVVETEKKTDVPHGEGEVPIPDTASPQAEGVEGGGQSEIPPLPEETEDLGKVLDKARFVEQQSPQRQETLPEQVPDFRNEGSAMASLGGISINTTAWDFAPYLLDLKQRVKQHWIPPLAFTALGAIHGYTVVLFRIYPDGRMQMLQTVEEEGHDSLHRASVNAIKGAAPFRPLPKDFPEDYLEVRFGFYYLLPGDADRYFRKTGQ
jgi:outer membrane biosynthesis protein TonB